MALIHFLTALATSRMKMRRFSFTWSLAAETIRLAMFSCKEPWVLIGLLAASTIPPYIELASRGRPTRVYVLHMALFVGLLVLGWTAVEIGGREAAPSAVGDHPPAAGDPGAVRHGPGALLGDRLVRARHASGSRSCSWPR